MRKSIMDTYNEIKASRSCASVAREICFEYSSKYRRIVVLRDGNGFEIVVSYKSTARDIKTWTKRWGNLDHAIAWAKTYAENREISISPAFTIKEAVGVVLIDKSSTSKQAA